jgi:hypothetical protein
MKATDESKIYRKQMIELAIESKKSITIPANIIENETSDTVLGKIVRVMYESKRDEADARIQYLENQK